MIAGPTAGWAEFVSFSIAIDCAERPANRLAGGSHPRAGVLHPEAVAGAP